MDRLSPLDSLFLHVEDGVTHMHIASCAVFERPVPRYQEVVDLIASKLPVLRRYRQKVRFVPGQLGRPVWVDDPHFNLSYHLRHSALPPPGGEEELANLMGRLMTVELDRHRPLWEVWMVEGLSGGRWALISKVHHCMVDGVSGTDLMVLLLDPSRRHDPSPSVEVWAPAPEPSAAMLTVGAVVDLLRTPAEQLRAAAGAAAWAAERLPRASRHRGRGACARPEPAPDACPVDRGCHRAAPPMGRGPHESGRAEGDSPGARWDGQRRHPVGDHRRPA